MFVSFNQASTGKITASINFSGNQQPVPIRSPWGD